MDWDVILALLILYVLALAGTAASRGPPQGKQRACVNGDRRRSPTQTGIALIRMIRRKGDALSIIQASQQSIHCDIAKV